MKRIERLVNSSWMIYFERFLCAFSGLILSTLIVRFVSENEYGEIKSFLAYSEILKVVFSLGLGGMLIRFLPMISNKFTAARILKKSAFASLSFSIFLGILLFLSVNGLTVELLILSVLYMSKSIWFESFLISNNKRTTVAIIRSFGYISQVIIISTLVFFELHRYIKFSYVVIMFFEFSFFLYSYKKLIAVPAPLNKNGNIPENLTLIKYAGGVYLSSLIMLISSSSVKIVLITNYSTSEMVATFALACVFPNLIRSFSPSKILLGYMFPKIIRRSGGGKINRFTRARLILIYLYNNLFIVICSCLLIAFSLFIYQILYEKQLDNEFIVLIAMLCCTNVTLQFVDMHEVITSIKAQSGVFVAVSVVAIVSLFIYPYAISKYGVIGLVVGSFFSTNAILIAYFVLLKKNALIKFSLLNQSKAQCSILLFTYLICNQLFFLTSLLFIVILLITLPSRLFVFRVLKNVFS